MIAIAAALVMWVISIILVGRDLYWNRRIQAARQRRMDAEQQLAEAHQRLAVAQQEQIQVQAKGLVLEAEVILGVAWTARYRPDS